MQTFTPDHPVLLAAVRADPGRIVADERASREMLGLPPYGALAEMSGTGVDEFVASLPSVDGVVVAADGDGGWIARAGDWMQLGEMLSAGTRPAGSRLRIAVDPPR